MSKEKFVRDKPHVNIGSIFIIIFGLITMVSLGMMMYTDIIKTRDSDGDSIPDLIEANAGYSLFFDVSNDSLSFRTYDTGTGGHEVGHNLGISHDGVSTHVNVELGLLEDVSTETPIVDFNVKYDSLIEFVDGDGNGFFDPVLDTIIGKTTLDNMLRVGFGFGVDGEPAYYSNYSTVDGVLKLDFYTAREHVLLSRGIGLLSPFEVKSLLTITDYIPITGGTSLALNLSLSSTNNITFSGATSSAKLSIGDFEVDYEWDDSAIINSGERIVNTTTPSSAVLVNIGSIYMNFGEVVNATYDLKLHWQIPKTENGFNITDIPWSYITIGSIGIIAVGMAAKIPRGKKKSKPKPPPSKFDSIATSVEPTPYAGRKKPGRLTYESGAQSKKKVDDSDKRIPETLTHRDR